MHYWFQNLNERKDRLFHFRGSVGADYRKNWLKYEISSGPALKFEIQHGEAGDDDASTMIVIGVLFLTAYLTFHIPRRFYFQQKCIATWDGGREFYLVQGRRYGFYFYHWSFVWYFHAKVNESSSRDPWWMHQYWHLDEWLLGKWEVLEHEICSIDNVKFKLGEKEFVMDEIKWEKRRRFRRFIPYSLFHLTNYYVNMKINKPPMRAGKGENSWDCDDDGSFGMGAHWPHATPSWMPGEREAAARLAVDMYVKSHMRDVNKYGSGDGERGTKRGEVYEYIGRAPVSDGSMSAEVLP